jgi:predicted dehydrogenase
MSNIPSPTTIEIAVIGLGHWGPNHLRVFNSLAGSRVTAVCDVDAARTARAVNAYPGIRAFADPATLLKESSAHAVVIATPTSSHYALVRSALQAGKHVLCEKPLCLRAAEGEELTRLAETTGCVLMVGHVFLFNAGLIAIRKMLQDGEIGKPHYLAAVRTNLGPIRQDVNAAWDLASHDIAIFNWLLGSEPEAVVAMGASFLKPGNEDVVNITLRYPSNVMATALCSWLDPKKVRRMTLVGSGKMVTWDDMNMTSPVAIFEKGARTDLDVADYGQFLRVSMWDGDIRLPKIESAEPLKAQGDAFLAAVRTGSRPVADGAFGTGVVRVLESVSAALSSAMPTEAP